MFPDKSIGTSLLVAQSTDKLRALYTKYRESSQLSDL